MSVNEEMSAAHIGGVQPRDDTVQNTTATLVIEPAGRWPKIDFRELWAYRGLFFFLVWRDIKIRYAQTVLGAGWAILQPVLTMVVFTIIFGNFAKIPSDGVPYAVFSLAALVPWTYFSTAFSGASNSLVSNTNLITKIYFPRLVIPFAPVLAGLVDMAIAFAILLLVMLSFGNVSGPKQNRPKSLNHSCQRVQCVERPILLRHQGHRVNNWRRIHPDLYKKRCYVFDVAILDI